MIFPHNNFLLFDYNEVIGFRGKNVVLTEKKKKELYQNLDFPCESDKVIKLPTTNLK